MITIKNTKTKKIISSSYFKDIQALRSSQYETDYRDLYKNTKFDVEKLKKAYAVQAIILWKKGCAELSDYASKLLPHQLDKIETQYMGETWEDWLEPFDIKDMMKND